MSRNYTQEPRFFVANIDTVIDRVDTCFMPDRQTMNVSLPAAQERFVRSQVQTGRYRSASEVVRDGLRLLEEAEHRRLLEKWLYQDLSPEQLASLPAELVERARERFTSLIEEGIRAADDQGWVKSDAALDQLAERLRGRCEDDAP